MKKVELTSVSVNVSILIQGVPLGLVCHGGSMLDSSVDLLVEKWTTDPMPCFDVRVVMSNTLVDDDYQCLMSLDFYAFDPCNSHRHTFQTDNIEAQRDMLESVSVGGNTSMYASGTRYRIRGETDFHAEPVPAYFLYHLYAKPV